MERQTRLAALPLVPPLTDLPMVASGRDRIDAVRHMGHRWRGIALLGRSTGDDAASRGAYLAAMRDMLEGLDRARAVLSADDPAQSRKISEALRDCATDVFQPPAQQHQQGERN